MVLLYSHRNLKPSSGFTLIELLVVAAMIGITTGIGVAAYNSFRDRQSVEQAAKNLKSNLVLARSNAISGRKDPSCGGNTLNGWYADLDNKNYYGTCGSGSTTPFSSPKPLFEGNFGLSSTNTILFKPLIGDTDLDDDLTITVTPTGTSAPQAQVTIGRGGQIN